MEQKSKILFVVVGVFVALVFTLVLRTFSPSNEVRAGTPYAYQPDSKTLAQRMSRAVSYETISFGRSKSTSTKALLAFHAFLKKSFPRVYRTLQVETVNRYSLLYYWKGTPSRPALKPVILLGHLDVVPISPGTEKEWQHPPFKGAIKEGAIWGRGTLDNKNNIIGILTAVEDMLKAGITPSRDVYLAFGHDEEQGGVQGAGEISKVLESRGVRCEFLLDEGGVIFTDLLPDSEKIVAAISTAEKGSVTLSLTARGRGGHSSTPPPQSAIGILSAALVALEAAPFPQDFSHIERFFLALSDHMPWLERFFVKNMWLFRPLVIGGDDYIQATTRTTTAVTIVAGGVKSNVLPIEAAATVNFRILPGETATTVRARVIKTIDDKRIRVAFKGAFGNPSPVAPTEGYGWDKLTAAISDTLAGEQVIVVPQLLVAATDTRHYRNLCTAHYRYNAIRLKRADLALIHGTNEHITIKNLDNTARFFHRLLSGL